MQDRQHVEIHATSSNKTKLVLSLCLCLCLILAFFLLPAFLMYLQKGTPETKNVPIVDVNAGFDGSYRQNYWTPIHVTLTNGPDAFQGTLAVRAYTGGQQSSVSSGSSPWSFDKAVSLTPYEKQVITLYAPHYQDNFISQGFIATLQDNQNRTLVTKVNQIGYEVKPGDIFVGVLSTQSTVVNQLEKVLLPNQSDALAVAQLDASTFPTEETVLENFDILVIDDFPSNTLSAQQIAVLRTWINRGGALIEIGGADWEQTLKPLPADLTPVQVTHLGIVAANTHLLSFNGGIAQALSYTVDQTPADVSNSDDLSLPMVISSGTRQIQNVFSNNTTILSDNNTPLIDEAQQGAGSIHYLAFDPAANLMANWSGTTILWEDLFQRAMGDKLLIANNAQDYDSGPGQILTRGGILNMISPQPPQGPLLIIILVIGYLLVLGPGRFFLNHSVPRIRQWKIRILLSIIVIFSLVVYGGANYEKNIAVTDNSISLIQFNQNGQTAHITTYMGISVPGSGTFQLTIPGENLAEPVSSQFLVKGLTAQEITRNDVKATVTNNTNSTNMKIGATQLWSVTPVVSEQDEQMAGSITAHLTLRDNNIVGTITNQLHVSLSDLYLLLPHNTMTVGNLSPGETKQIDMPLHDNDAPISEESLADQIEQHAGLGTSYFPQGANQYTLSPFEKHMQLLSALSGVGYSYPDCGGLCQTHAITSKGVIYVTGGQIPDPNLKNDYDPLLIPGAQATLIGWTNQSLDGQDATTINGIIPQGEHSSMFQMPLNISFSGLLNVPKDFITGNVINVNSYDAQAILPGAYTMSTGSVTFELTLPDTTNISINGITVTVPDLIADPSGSNTGAANHNSNIHVELYNWSKQTWEAVKLTQDSFTTTTPTTYTGPNGRILIQISSQDLSQIYFGKPLLNLNGSAPI